ncbi:16S rRNA (adenine(1518)-N(6)/adenine(1519)-N(6))-dimethyltransferase RsmA [Poritiphilus sp. M415]|uniref:Ribosomal RNA small subunit methyltransferase A n=1 Tax=Lentiprolixibacter aurantiacus TaxID=2993939 RepID=A0AAE3MJN4_9FLAO|nr:16S rRNA (adenine(1518)-N(6)/adenine(1519)-N(6))-dimethyltransferase RsmA [Lentiprolixibacter aurantiacus]MCX2718856.1 16S rRNA (adenine(1518)-N(6)/adenine(1519)-N(6))-dimethyltransferase RsmA [Lentiprolixibacter aurantiacus]
MGQHFLKDENIARKIADTLLLKDCSNVLEIGPGMGVLTRFLLEKEISLCVMEIDTESVSFLKEHFPLLHPETLPHLKKLEILEADFLKEDLSALFSGEDFAITGNFPYNISSQIVFKMLKHRDRIPEFSGMFQKEVAKRICEKKGSKAYGILSVLTQAFYEARYLFTVHPEVFDPPPKVQSGVIHLARKQPFQLECDEALFFRVVKAAFNHRRKTLRNSLKTFDLSDNLKEDTIFDQRPEQLDVSDFIALTRKIENDTV